MNMFIWFIRPNALHCGSNRNDCNNGGIHDTTKLIHNNNMYETIMNSDHGKGPDHEL